MNIVLAIGFATILYKFMDMARFIANSDWASAKTQSLAWGAGIGGTFLWAQTQMADSVSVNGIALSKLSSASLICVGVAAASAAGVGYTLKKALDASDSAKSLALFKK